jgi:integrase
MLEETSLWADCGHSLRLRETATPDEEADLQPRKSGCLSLPNPSGGFQSFAAVAIRLIVLIGARKNEVLTATWDQFDLEEGVWTKPSSHTKQKRKHRVPLSAPALAVLRVTKERQGDGGYYNCTGKVDVRRGDIKSAWDLIRMSAGIEDVRVHDLRHTYASILVSGGVSLTVIEQLLGHTQQATTARYAHLSDDPLRAATNRVSFK